MATRVDPLSLNPPPLAEILLILLPGLMLVPPASLVARKRSEEVLLDPVPVRVKERSRFWKFRPPEPVACKSRATPEAICQELADGVSEKFLTVIAGALIVRLRSEVGV